MNNKLTEITVTHNGEQGKLSLVDYQAFLVKEFSPSPYTPPGEGAIPVAGDKVVAHIIKSFNEERPVDVGIAGVNSSLVERVQADFKYTRDEKSGKAANAADKKKEAEEAKAKKEADDAKAAAELAIVQTGFAEGFVKGANLAAEEFATELETLKTSLPEGVNVTSKGNGLGLELAEGTSKETIGITLGYLKQKSENTNFIGNQLDFFIGDLVVKSVEAKVFDTAKEAGKYIEKYLLEQHSKKLSLVSIDANKRMAERTPIELRNPKADPTAYLAISMMKTPKKGDKETDEQFKARNAKFESDRMGLQAKIASGEIEKRKDILPLVDEVAYSHGIKERPPEIAPTPASVYFRQFFEAQLALDEFVGVHAEYPDAAVYKLGEDLHPVTREKLEEIKDEAKAALALISYKTKDGIELTDYARGYVMKEVKTEVTKDSEGKPVFETSKVKNFVYPRPFWEVPKKEEAPAEEAPAEGEKKEDSVEGEVVDV